MTLTVFPAASEAHLGEIGGRTQTITSTPTLSVAGAYISGDYVGPSTTSTSFANAVRISGGTGIIKALTIVDKITTAAPPLELWLFNASITVPTDNAAWSISDADAAKCQSVIVLDTSRWYASALNKVYFNDQLSVPIQPTGTGLFYALVTRGAITWTNGDLQLAIAVMMD